MFKAESPEQLELIRTQLGREPRGIIKVAAASKEGVPLVLQMRSWVDQPFPTLFWLSSKDIHHALAKIETAGWVKQIEAELAQDEELAAAYLQNQKDYVALRWQQMLPEDKAIIEAKGFSHLFDEYGIGGLRDWRQVRCLHMQYAQHLVQGNVIGARLDKEFGLDELEIRI